MEDKNLPVLHESEYGAVRQLRTNLSKLDGPLSISRACVPREAVDVGDVPISANPTQTDLADADMACDDGMIETYTEVERSDGTVVMHVTENAESFIEADEADVIDDITTWA